MTPVNGHDDRQPPQNLDAERALLGALLLSDAQLEDVFHFVDAATFYRPAHGSIFAAIVDVHSRGEPVDHLTVLAELSRRGELLHVGGAPYLHALIADVPRSAAAPYYAELIAEAGVRRRILEAGQRLQQLAHLDTHDVDDIIERARDELGQVAIGGVRGADRTRLLSGGDFIHGASDTVPALWGRGEDVLWAEGEPLLIVGPTGVGKTTVAGQLLAARLGLIDSVLGMPVAPGRRVLYLAMDRPSQIQRAHGRLLRQFPPELLNDRLVAWKGPPPQDLARAPETLLRMARSAGADTVFVDSVKDAAVKLSDEETGQGLNRAFQLCVASGVEVAALHHQRKAGAGGQGKPNTLSDVYGSTWITAGCGSVLLLWGSAGDPVVELSHLKQPAALVGPLRLLHDQEAGTTQVRGQVDVLDFLDSTPRTVREIAMALRGSDGTASDSDVERARRRLDRLVKDGLASKRQTAAPGATSSYVRAGQRGSRTLFEAETGEGSRGVTR